MLGSLGQWQERRMLTASYGTMMTTVIILLALVASPVAMGLQYEDPENVFMANLNGSNNVPPIDTNATAVFSMSPADDGTVAFALAIWNIQNFTMAHIHAGNATTNGPIVVPLVPLPQERQTTVDGLQEVSPPQSGDLYFLYVGWIALVYILWHNYLITKQRNRVLLMFLYPNI